MPPPPERATLLHHGEGFQFATWREVFIQHWTVNSGPEDMRTLQRLEGGLVAARRGAKCIRLAWLQLPSIRTPDEESRRLIEENREFMQPHTAGSVLILEASGFVASIVRGLLSAQRLVQRRTHPSATVATAREGSVALARMMQGVYGAAVPATEIEAMLADLLEQARGKQPPAAAAAGR